MIEDTASLLRRIELLEARVGLLETKKTRTKRVKSTAGNINLDDDADLFATTPERAPKDGNEVSFETVDLGTLD
jgi:hypothetical protein